LRDTLRDNQLKRSFAGREIRETHRVVDIEDNKELVRRLVKQVVDERNLDALDDVAGGEVARAAKGWIGPFRRSFPDFRMEIVDMIGEGDKVVAHFKCSGTHEGEWRGVAPTGRRFEDVDEIYIFRIANGRLISAVAVEDNLTRMRQLGFEL
jgi:predicted ester cyclase